MRRRARWHGSAVLPHAVRGSSDNDRPFFS